MKVIAIVPGRMNSKRFPGKNMALLRGRPLISYTIRAAKESCIFDEIYVDSEDAYVLMLARNIQAIAQERPEVLRAYNTTTNDIVKWYFDNIEADCYVLLMPTSPLRTAQHIKEGFALFQKSKINVISVNETTLQPNGGFWFCKHGQLPYTGIPLLYRMSARDSMDVDHSWQLNLAEGLLNERDIERVELLEEFNVDYMNDGYPTDTDHRYWQL